MLNVECRMHNCVTQSFSIQHLALCIYDTDTLFRMEEMALFSNLDT